MSGTLKGIEPYYGIQTAKCGHLPTVCRESQMVHYIVLHPNEFGITEILKTELNAGPGEVDIFAYEKQPGKHINFIAIEVKDELIDCAAVGQLTRYVTSLRTGKLTENCNGWLIGRAIQRDAMHLASALGYKVILWTRYGHIEHVTPDVFPVATPEEKWGVTTTNYFLSEWFKTHGPKHV